MSFTAAYHWGTMLACLLVYAWVAHTHAAILREEEPDRFEPGYRSETGHWWWKLMRALPLAGFALAAPTPVGLVACSALAGLGLGSAAFRLVLNHGMGWRWHYIGTTKRYDRLLRRHSRKPGRLAYALDLVAFTAGTVLAYACYA